jgi:hypothetical protein
MQNRKVSTLIGITIILAVAIIVFAGVFAFQYFALKNNQIPNQNTEKIVNNQNSNTETASWKTFTVNKGGYVFVISVGECNEEKLSGWCTPVKRDMNILDAKTSNLIQNISLKDYSINRHGYNRVISSESNNYPDLTLTDINFDGKNDLMIRSGSSGGAYEVSSYDIYLYNFNTNAFILSKDLTDLLKELEIKLIYENENTFSR